MSRKRVNRNIINDVIHVKRARPSVPFVELNQSIILYHLWPFFSVKCALALIRVCNDVKNRFFYQMPKRFALSLRDERLYDTNYYNDDYTHDLSCIRNYKFNTILPIPRSYEHVLEYLFHNNYPGINRKYKFDFENSDVFDASFYYKLPLTITWCFPVRFCGTFPSFINNRSTLRQTTHHWIIEDDDSTYDEYDIGEWIMSDVLSSVQTLILDCRECNLILEKLISSIYVSQIKALHIIHCEDEIEERFIEKFTSLETLEIDNDFDGEMTFPPNLKTLIFTNLGNNPFDLRNCHSLQTFVWKGSHKLDCNFLPSSLTSLIDYSKHFPRNLSRLNSLTELSLLRWTGKAQDLSRLLTSIISVSGEFLYCLPTSITSLSLPSYNQENFPPLISSAKLIHLPKYEGKITKYQIQASKEHPVTITVKKRQIGRPLKNTIIQLVDTYPQRRLLPLSFQRIQYLINNPQYIKQYLVFHCHRKLLRRLALFLDKYDNHNTFETRHVIEFLRRELKRKYCLLI